jgi:hypothetical protein
MRFSCIINKILGKAPDWAADGIARYPFLEPHEHYHLQRVAHDLLAKTGGEVFAGPLAGMKIPLDSPLANLPMYVLGSYEQETHEVLSRVICAPPPKIIIIGSAFGYYTVGLACQTMHTKVIGFEAEEHPHWKKAAELATLNKVADRITQKGFCDTNELYAVCEDGDFVMCDCEGGEVTLLDPVKTPALKNCEILCEVHEFYAPHATAILVERFKVSHQLNLINEQPRNPARFRVLFGLSDSYQKLSVAETRHVNKKITPLRYLHMVPKVSGL